MDKSNNTTKNIVIKAVAISVVTTTMGSMIVYNTINTKFNKEINSLRNEVKVLKEENEKQTVKIEEPKLDAKDDKVEEEAKKDSSSQEKIIVSNPVNILDGVFDIMNKANGDLEKVHNKITNSGTFSGLQGTFDTLSNYGSQLIDQVTKLDLSNVGGVETSDIITSIGYELQGLSDSDNMADEALNIMGTMGEFMAHIDYAYNNSENN